MSTTVKRCPPRSGIRAFRPRKRLPRPSQLGWALLFTVAILIGGVTGAIVRAEDGDETPVAERYQPSSRGTRPTVTQWRPLLSAYDWDVDQALRVIDCESEGRPGVYNRQGSGAVGLFQLLGWSGLAERLFGTRDLTNPWVNVAVAYVLWADSGSTFRWHWYASIGCWR